MLGGISSSQTFDDVPNPNLQATVTTLIEAFNPFTRTWSVAGNMASQLTAHVSVVLANGQVLTTGG